MALTDVKVRNTKPCPAPFKLFDGDGLFLLVAPSGGKWWRFKYRFDGKEKLLSLGVYPQIGLREARDKRAEARTHLAGGIDPSEVRRAQRAAQGQDRNVPTTNRMAPKTDERMEMNSNPQGQVPREAPRVQDEKRVVNIAECNNTLYALTSDGRIFSRHENLVPPRGPHEVIGVGLGCEHFKKVIEWKEEAGP